MKGKTSLWLACALAALALMVVLMANGENGGQPSQQEQRIAEVLSAMAGAGKVEVALYYGQQEQGVFSSEGTGVPTGAVVVAQGADDLNVRLKLIRAMRTLLGLSENAVDVFVMEEGR